MTRPPVAALAAIVAVTLAAAVAPTLARAASASGGESTVVELRVWQDVLSPRSLLVSARPEGGDWRALGTVPLPQGGTSEDAGLRYGDVAVGDAELRIWQGVDDPLSVSVSARPAGGDWSDPRALPLDDGHSLDGRFRYGDLRIVVPPGELPPPVAVSPGGSEVPRLAVVTIAFRAPPSEMDGGALVSIDPPADGSFVWADARTLLFQPAYPGWQRGQRYELRVDAAAAGLTDDHMHAFTVSGGLEVAYVIPGDGDREVPPEAQILVQFNRSVAALTVLQEGDAPPVLEFDPPIAGTGEWLNTSLYRFTPGEGLPPGALYRVRIPAGLTAAADGALPSDFEWSFSTSQPAITRFEPGDGSTFVEPDGPFVVTFSQPMDRASVEDGLVLATVDGSPVTSSFAWSEGDTVVAVIPAEPLELGGTYRFVARAGLLGAKGGATPGVRDAFFTVVEPPQLVGWSEHADATGITLYYNNPMDLESFEGRVSISGIDASGIEFSASWLEGVVVVSVRLEYSTEYTVRIAEGVRDRGGRTLPASEFSITTGEPPPPRPPRPSLTFAVPSSFITVSASERQVLHYYSRALDEARFRLYRLSDSEAETLLRRGFIDGWGWRDGEETRIVFSPESGPMRSWTEEIEADPAGAPQRRSTAVSVGEPLPKGHYLLAAEYDDERYDVATVEREKLVLSVVDTALVTKLAFDELIVWALDYGTGAPLEDVTVRTVPIEDPPSSPYQSAQTGGDGLARFAVTADRGSWWRPYGDHLARVETGGRSGVASTWWETGASPWDLGAFVYVPTPVAHLYTDRPIYRPGETVYYKGVLREDDDAAYSLPGPAELRVTIRDSRGRDAHVATAQTDTFGAISGAFEIPVDAVTGAYSVSVSHAGRGGSTWFEVAEFRAPEFEVEVATDAADYVAGDAIATEARARFYFDGPVRDARVQWAARAWRTSIRVEGYDGYSFSDRDRHRSAPSPDRGRGGGETRTDASGVARFEAPARLEQGEGTLEFTISATVTDASGQAVAGSTTATVHPATWYAGIRTGSSIARAGEPATIHLVTVDFESRIAPERPVTVRIYRREWVRTRERAPGGGYVSRYEVCDTEVEALRATTDAVAEAALTFTPPSSGLYRLVAESLDDRERVARSASSLWVSGSDRASWPVREDDIIDLIADREQYEVGDVAEVLVPAPFAGATALVTIERGRVLSSEVRTLETNSEVLRIPIEDAHIPNIYIGVVLYRPPTADDPYARYKLGSLELPVSTAPRELDVRIEPDREQALPGETVSYEVTVKDAEGRGVAADVAVAVVDRAVLALADQVEPDGMRAFWFERALGVHTASSLAVLLDRWNEPYRDGEAGGRALGDFSSSPLGHPVIAPNTGAAAPDGASELPPPAGPRVRSDFQSTALWIGRLTTDERGRAAFELPLPDNATTWRARARAVSAATQVGEGESELLVTQPLLVRPALPRFLRVGDRVELRALVRNGAADARKVTVTVEAEGVTLDDDAARTVTIAPGASATVGWPARAIADGAATIRFRAAGGGQGDAVETTLPVHLDVTPETTATGGVVEDAPAVEAVYLPDYVITGTGSLELSLQGSLVGALDEELSSLRPYRGESIVRTASRVVAAIAVTRATPGGLDGARARQLEADLARLGRAQRWDGSWGWCHSCREDLWVTGWALIALGEAGDAGHAVPASVVSRAARRIYEHVHRVTDVERPADPNQHAYLLYALARASRHLAWAGEAIEQQRSAMRAIIEEHRSELTNWSRAYLLLGLLATGHATDHADVRLLLNDLTARTIAGATGNHWEDERTAGSMHNRSVRTTAIVLRALTEVDPRHALLEETARWLAHARSARSWKTDVERAQGMASLGAYAELTGETSGAYDYSVLVNARRVLHGDFDVPGGDYLDAASVALADLPLGEVSRVQFDRGAEDPGRLYYGLNLRYVTPAQDVEALNRGLAVSRRYSLLDDPGTPVASAPAGDVVRVVVTVVAPADRLFARVEDFLPAGLEPIDPQLNIVSPYLREQLEADRAEALRGGAPAHYAPWYRWYWSPWSEVQIRDDRVVLLATRLPRGVHEYVYYARATTPGDFFVAPAHAEESYFPDVFGRGDSSRFTVVAAE